MAVGSNDLPDLATRLRALRSEREKPGFRSLVLAAKRIFNIVKDSPEFDLQPELLVEEAEKDLYAELVDVRRAVDTAAGEQRYEDCLKSMAGLVPGLDRFFAEVLVSVLKASSASSGGIIGLLLGGVLYPRRTGHESAPLSPLSHLDQYASVGSEYFVLRVSLMPWISVTSN